MKAILLVAGYAVRLKPLTDDTPKALIEIKGKPILTHIVDKLKDLPITELVIVSNNRFYTDFLDWSKKIDFKGTIKVLNDGTNSVEDKKGAIGDLKFATDELRLKEDVFVAAGDNLFNFSLMDAYAFFKKKKSSVVIVHDVGWLDLAKQLGVVELDKENKVIDFIEKPEVPPSTMAATGIYFFTLKDLSLLDAYLKEGKSEDAPGYFLEWLSKKSKVFAQVHSEEWFDIGTFPALEQAKEKFIPLGEEKPIPEKEKISELKEETEKPYTPGKWFDE